MSDRDEVETFTQAVRRIYAEMDLSPEACETIAGMYESYPVALYVRALSARLTEAEARVAAAYEEAALWLDQEGFDGDHIRALVPDAERDALAERDARIKAENARLREALERVMIGGNHLGLLIGTGHPEAGTEWPAVLAHYGAGPQYEAWCCWNAIMRARAALHPDREGE